MGAVGVVNEMAGTEHLEMVGALQALRDVITDAAHPEQPHVVDPSGGTTVDTEARTAINSTLDLLEAAGLMATA